MDEKEFRLEIRLIAIEQLLARMFAIQMAHYTEEQFDAICRAWVDGISNDTFEGASAVEGDLLSAEIADSLRELLQMAGEIRKRLRKT